MFKINIGNASYSVNVAPDFVEVDGEPWNWNLVRIDEHLFHLIKDSKSYLIELVATLPEEKQVHLKINGILYQAQVQDKYDLLLEKLGMKPDDQINHLEVRAPMPGKILDILVSKGQPVAKGDNLLVLEAMKMENIIKSAGSGTVEVIFVKKGMNVEKNQVLIRF